MASHTKSTWTKRNNRDAKKLKRRHKRLAAKARRRKAEL